MCDFGMPNKFTRVDRTGDLEWPSTLRYWRRLLYIGNKNIEHSSYAVILCFVFGQGNLEYEVRVFLKVG